MTKVRGRLGRPQTLVVARESEVDQLFAAVFDCFNRSQTEAAKRLGVSQPQFRAMLVRSGKEAIPLELAIDIELATNGRIRLESLNKQYAEKLANIEKQRSKDAK